MSNDDNETIEAIVAGQRALIRALHAASPSWLELNVTMAQLKTLIVLYDEGPIPVGQVGCRMGVTLPTASYQVERLVRAGLVERVEDTRDRRRTLVHLTPKAEELVRSLRQGRAGQLRAWLCEMSSEDLHALDRGLSALTAIASAQREATAPASSGAATALAAAEGSVTGE
jgi:MarR family transcriptional regulator, organic hydroperoxide resistance regulator